MLEKVIALDKELLVYLNGLGSETFDSFWLAITEQTTWIPLFVVLLYLIHKKIGTKQTLYLLLAVGILITLTDQTANLFKHGFQRLRPCNDPDTKDIIRIVKGSPSFSFFSAHAANSMGMATFLFLNFRKQFRFWGLLFLWPLIFAYSRIYLGLHFPLDILTGYFFGALYGTLVFFLYRKAKKKNFPESQNLN